MSVQCIVHSILYRSMVNCIALHCIALDGYEFMLGTCLINGHTDDEAFIHFRLATKPFHGNWLLFFIIATHKHTKRHSQHCRAPTRLYWNRIYSVIKSCKKYELHWIDNAIKWKTVARSLLFLEAFIFFRFLFHAHLIYFTALLFERSVSIPVSFTFIFISYIYIFLPRNTFILYTYRTCMYVCIQSKRARLIICAGCLLLWIHTFIALQLNVCTKRNTIFECRFALKFLRLFLAFSILVSS